MRFDLLNAFGFVYEGEIMECVADDLCSFCCFVLTKVFFLVFKRVVHLRRLLMLSFSCVAFFFRWELIAIGSSRVSIWSNVCGSIYFLGKRVVVRRRRFVFVFLCSFVWENINCDWKYSCVLRLSKVFGII